MARGSSRPIEEKTERCFVKGFVLAVGLLAVNRVAALAGRRAPTLSMARGPK